MCQLFSILSVLLLISTNCSDVDSHKTTLKQREIERTRTHNGAPENKTTNERDTHTEEKGKKVV